MTEIRSAIEARLDALEKENVTQREAIAILETGVACHKPIRLRERQNAALRVIVESVQLGPNEEPFVRPHHTHHGLQLKERAVNYPDETRAA
jgi:uncharacterized coiled-coil protein SlyX